MKRVASLAQPPQHTPMVNDQPHQAPNTCCFQPGLRHDAGAVLVICLPSKEEQMLHCCALAARAA